MSCRSRLPMPRYYFFWRIAAPRFFRPDALRREFVVSNAPVLVAAVGMTLVILCRQIDISIASIFSICGVVAGLMARRAPDRGGRGGHAGGRRRIRSDQWSPGRTARVAIDRGDARDTGDRPRIAALRA